MSQKVEPIYRTFQDIDGQPLESGYIYVGTATLSPKTNQIAIYSDPELTTALTQPVRTAGGYAMNAGSPTNIYAAVNDFSIDISNKNNTTVYSSGVNANDYFNIGATGSVARTVNSKLSDVVSVKDFGAVGDGTTDDTTALNNAFAYAAKTGAGKCILPKGTYLVSDVLYMGGLVEGTNGSVVTAQAFGGAEYSDDDNLGEGSIILWDKTVLTTSSVHIQPIVYGRTYADYYQPLNIRGVTFASKSAASVGGGILIQFSDGGAQSTASFHDADGSLRDCNICNFTTGNNLLTKSTGFFENIVFRGCLTAVSMGTIGVGGCTDITYIGSRFEACGASTDAYIKLSNCINPRFIACTMQTTSQINLGATGGNIAFDKCWFEAQNIDGTSTFMNATSSQNLGTISFTDCHSGGSSGTLDLTDANNGHLSIKDSDFTSISISLNSSQQYTEFGDVSLTAINPTGVVDVMQYHPLRPKYQQQFVGSALPVTFDAGNFTAGGSMTWTVLVGEVLLNSYSAIYKTLKWSVNLNSTTTGGTADPKLKVQLPISGTVSANSYGQIQIYNGSAWGIGAWRGNGTGILDIYVDLTEGTNWPLSGNISIRGSFDLVLD